ncbi:MAG: hypothetical protein M3P44_06300 [Actinomycetota bacterium]|nr:hypothetical protein [Actinomycetota bacterium]
MAATVTQPRLRRSDCSGPGIHRVRRGRGFRFDRGFFRVGGEDYAVRNETYGLATMHKKHVRLRDEVLLFDYPAKHGGRRCPSLGHVAEPHLPHCVLATNDESTAGRPARLTDESTSS